MTHLPLKVGILLFDDVEILDFCGPYEVFSVTQRPEGGPAFEVVTVAEKSEIRARNGLSVNPDCLLQDSPKFDLFLIPGGQGTRRELHNQSLLNWIESKVKETPLVLSVCTGALLLAKIGVLKNLKATTHANGVELLKELSPETEINRAQRYIDNGKYILSAGISAGIDMSLHVVDRLLGNEVAQTTATYMEYYWSPE